MKKTDLPSQERTALIYARVSSKEQEREGYSIDAQLRILHDYAVQKGFQIIKEYVDIETAKQSGRVNFTEMIRFLKGSSKTPSARTIILVEKTDRLYRNFKDWVTVDDLDVEIHCVREGEVISRESRSSEKFIHGIKVLMAKNYIDNLSEEVKKGMLEKATQGHYPGKPAPGYRSVKRDEKHHIEPVPELVPGIKRLFEWYATGNYSVDELALKAKAEGLYIDTKGASPARTTVHKILTNPVYYGSFRWAGRLFPGSHQPIISKALFDHVQDELEQRNNRRTGKRKHDWPFQGLLSCGHCGCALSPERKKNRYVYYHCTHHLRKCPGKYATENEIAQQFSEALRAIQLDKEIAEWIVTALKESHDSERVYHDNAVAEAQRQYQQIQRRIDTMYVDKLDGRVSQQFFDERAAEWRTEQSEILRRIEGHQNANQAYLSEGVRILELASRAADLYDAQPMTEKRKLINLVFSNSSWKDGKLTPTYRKPFDLIVEANALAKKEKAASDDTHGLHPVWLGNRDSNPDSQIQSLVSCQLDDSPKAHLPEPVGPSAMGCANILQNLT